MLKKSVPALALLASMAAAASYQSGWTPGPPPSDAPVPLAAAPKPAPADPAIGLAVAEWNRLRQSDSLPFQSYASFLLAHPGWPGEAAMRRAAEKAIRPDAEPAATVAAFFARFPATTAAGRAAQADALLASGRTAEAQAAARAAWTGGVLSPTDEARLLDRFGASLTPADQDARMERLLWDRASGAAARQLPLVSAARRPIYAARLAMQTRSADAAAQSDALRPAADRDPGFELDRALWLRDTARSGEARAYLARPAQFDGLPLKGETWLEGMLGFARAAAADNQGSLAYAIASRADAAFPAGTDVRSRTAGERDDYTSLVWLAGTTALKKLARPADAGVMFAKYAAASRTPQSQSKGQYWAGRAADAARSAEATAWYDRAAGYYDQFYGQLAAERLGRTLPVPATPAPTPVSATEQAAFDARETVRAARWLGLNGSWADQTQFVRAIAAAVETEADHRLATQLAADIARPDLGVMVGRAARREGGVDYVRAGFPEVTVPPAYQSRWVMIHAISRQESQFDREALSVTGARGLMQLMPGTAREVAGKLGLPYEATRLTADPQYNMTLGTSYFTQMLDRYGGNHVLAVAAYNAGPGNVAKFIRANGDPRLPGVDVVDWIEAIPFTETRGYVQRVLENAVVYDLLNPSRARMAANNRLSAYLGRTGAG